MSRVAGTISFPRLRAPLERVTIHVHLEDVSRVDTAASTVAEQVLRDVRVDSADTRVPFELPETPLRERCRYAVRVHADVDGDAAVSVGDYVSTQSYPVSPEPTTRLSITVSLVE